MLGWSIWAQNRRRPHEESLRHIERAVELVEGTTERDRLFIEGSYYSLTDQDEKAAAKYEALLDLYPDHHYALNDLRAAYRSLGREPPVELILRQADARPTHLGRQRQAATLLTRTDRLERAKIYIERAKAISSTETLPALVAFFPVYEHWLHRRIDETLSELDTVAGTIEFRDDRREFSYEYWAGAFYLALGQLEKAAEWFGASNRMPSANHYYLAWIADAVDDYEGLGNRLRAYTEARRAAGLNPMTARPLRWVRGGVALEPDDLQAIPGYERLSESPRQLALGELSFRRGDWRQAIELLEQGVEATGRLEFYQGSESLATAWQKVGDNARALRVLEHAAGRKARYEILLSGPSGKFRVQARLARVYRALGRIDEAVALEDEVLHMLKYADADHPVVLQIKEARQASTVKTQAQ